MAVPVELCRLHPMPLDLKTVSICDLGMVVGIVIPYITMFCRQHLGSMQWCFIEDVPGMYGFDWHAGNGSMYY